jgi:hypothetical protein
MERCLAGVFAVLLVFSGAARRVAAQTQTTGDVAGVVTDQSGAIVSGAKIVLMDDAKGSSRETRTNRDGSYRFYLLAPGSYTVTFTAPGFQTSKRSVKVSLGEVTSADLELTLGPSNQTVVVNEESPLTQSENGDVASTLTEGQIQQIPNSGNDLTFTAQMAAGSVMNTGGGGAGNFSSFGISAVSNLYALDGMDENEPFFNVNHSGATNLTLGNNEVQEVSVIANAYSGQYGGLAGAQVSIVTQGGTNTFGGRATYYWNGRTMNANDWFNKFSGVPRSFVNANQWGADIGGPLVKNKVFWYFNTEGLYLVIPTSTQALLPSTPFAKATEARIESRFGRGSAPDIFYQNMFKLYADAPGAAGATPVQGGGCDSSVASINAVLPPGTSPFGAPNPCAKQLASNVSTKTHDWLVVGRMDWNIGNDDRMHVRIEKEHGLQATFTDAISPLFNLQSDQPEYQGQFQWTRVLGSSAVNQFIGSGRWYSAVFSNANRSASLAAFPGTLVFFSGAFTSLGGNDYFFPQGRNVTQVQFSDDFSKAISNHTLKIGLKFRRNDLTDYDTGQYSAGYLDTESLDAFFNGGYDPNPANTAANLTFDFQSFAKSTKFPVAEYNLGGYAEDDWKVGANLSLTLALRLEHQSNPVCPTRCFAAPRGPFETLDHNPTVPYNQVIVANLRKALPRLTSINPEPRFGFAYTPHRLGLHGETVIRGGVGFFYDAFPAVVADSFAENSPAFNFFAVGGSVPGYITPGQTGNLFQAAAHSNAAFLAGFHSGESFQTIAAQVPGFLPPLLTSSTRNPKTPQYQKWSLELQHRFGENMSWGLEYVGNHGIHIFTLNNGLNAYDPGGFAGFPLSPTDPRFGEVAQVESNGVSNYHGLTTTFTKRWRGGEAQVNYTWSHAFDTVSNGGIPAASYEAAGVSATNNSMISPEDPFHPRRYIYGNADYDVRHYLSANYIWQLPIRRAFLGHGWKSVVDGWQVSGTVFARSGLPYTLVDSTTSLFLSGSFNYGTGADPSVFGNQIARGPEHVNCASEFPGQAVPNRDICFNAALYAASPHGFGNVTRNQLRGPHYFNSDFTIMKQTTIPRWERARFGIGFQFFNVFNHPNFDAPVADVTDIRFGRPIRMVSAPTSIFGSLLGADASPRLIQLKGQFSF